MRDIPPTVPEQVSVRNGKMKGHDIRTLRKVANEANAVLLVDDTNWAAASWSTGRCEVEDTRLVIVLNRIGPPPHDPCGPGLTSPLALWHCVGGVLPLFEAYKPSRARRFTVGCRRPPEEILAHIRAEELTKVYNLSIFNTTREFTKTLALVS
ncbi:hypothetical protein EDB89DRAFT_2072597 [Lactarius sanguifluus]|nr:hypothetical protein EDB89DRAFT_2072597 [Lactarius sanguifluus]